MFEDLKREMQKINEIVTQAVEADKASRQAYIANAAERRAGVDEKIQELQAELGTERAANNLRPQKMSKALSMADADTALQIEKDMATSNAKIAELEHKISLLGRSLPKGDPKLFFTAIKTYRRKFKELSRAAKELQKVNARLKDISRELKAKEETAERTHHSITVATRDKLDSAALIEMVESFEGPILVDGHSAGRDEEAKIRYIQGNARGIENTPAGDRLMKQPLDED